MGFRQRASAQAAPSRAFEAAARATGCREDLTRLRAKVEPAGAVAAVAGRLPAESDEPTRTLDGAVGETSLGS